MTMKTGILLLLLSISFVIQVLLIYIYTKINLNNHKLFTKNHVLTFISVVFMSLKNLVFIYLSSNRVSNLIFEIGFFLVWISCDYLWSYELIKMFNQGLRNENKEAVERFQLIFNTGPDVVIISSLQSGFIVEVNDAFVDITGYTREEVIGKTTKNIKYWNVGKEREKVVKIIEENGSCENFEFVARKKDASLFDGLLSAKKFNLDGVPHIISFTRDITVRKLIEEKIKVLSQAVEQSPASIILTDINGDIEYVNRKFVETTGYTFDEIVGLTPKILKSGYHSKEFYEDLWTTVLSGKEWMGEFVNQRKNGELYWESAKISPIINDSGEMKQLIAIKEDITDRKRLEEELQNQARTDVLTGIPNRRFFIECMENELSKNQRNPRENAFLMLDIDHFKIVNDNHGHTIGDIALKTIAKVCKETIRDYDVFGRIGGEEFAVFLIETEYEEALKIAERLRVNVENIELFDAQGDPVALRISIGITKYHHKEDTLETLMVRSDNALYLAKNQGRNRVVSTL